MKWKDLISPTVLCIYIFLVNIMDALTTYYGVFTLGLREQSPIPKLLFDNNMFLHALVIKFFVISLILACVWFAYHYHKLTYDLTKQFIDRFDMYAYYFILIILAVGFSYVVINNTYWIIGALYG
jgi:hypothetical protein